MQTLLRRIALMVGCSMVAVGANAQVALHKLTPFVTDTQARMELAVTAPKGFTGEARATITACSNGEVVWDGIVGTIDLKAGADTTAVELCIDGIKANLWTPATPHLYNLEVKCGESSITKRIGFRKFEMRDGRFYLNDKPIFLRGNAINPPNRGIPEELEVSREFARDYVRFLKGMNINIIRIPTDQNWLDVCDEEGMMIFGGRYGRPRITDHETNPPTDLENIDKYVDYYIEKEFTPLTWHPSVVIYVMSNEMPYKGSVGKKWDDFLQACYEELIKWDHTRPYIGNAGYGMGRSADIFDVHRYWGWYYNSFLTYMNLRDAALWQNEGKVQAVTFTECVGNYTGIDGAYNLCSRTKQPGSQKCWTGHIDAADQGEAALEYQAMVLKNATEMFRRFRPQNPYLAGVMPFTIIFHNWDSVKSFAEMRPKPVAYQYGISYQPILISWENWNHNVYAGNSIKVVAHVVNDDDQMRDLDGAKVVWRLENMRKMAVAEGTIELPTVEYYGTWSQALNIDLPEWAPTGDYRLVGEIVWNGKIVSTNTSDLYIAGAEWKNKNVAVDGVALYDTTGATAAAFDKNGVAYTLTTTVPKARKGAVLVIGEESWGADFAAQKDALKAFVEKGGRVFVMRQKPDFNTSWLPDKVEMLDESNNSNEYLSPEYTYCDGMNINIERKEHPIFKDVDMERLKLWSDYTDYDETKAGFPAIYPVTNGFSVRKADMEHTAVLANYSRNLSGTALCEMFKGKGSVVLSGFDLVGRSGVDPMADLLLRNIVNYLTSGQSEDACMLVEESIWWGDYTSERGIVTGANNGLVLNTFPIVPTDQKEKWPLKVDVRGYNYVGGYGGWNTRPGIQYVANGRRPFAPYNYSLGGNDLVTKEDEMHGSGYFAARVPADRTTMITLLANPSEESLEVSISINGEGKQTYTLAPQEERLVEMPLPKERTLRVDFEGSRRCVILMTEFK